MKIRVRLKILALLPVLIAIRTAGCRLTQPAKPLEEVSDFAPSPVTNEIQNLAEKPLGPGAEILFPGDLARNGWEQILAVNRFEKRGRAKAGTGDPAGVFIAQALVLEKRGDRWAEVLSCDERVKNPRGCLGGISATSASGWLLHSTPETTQGLRLEFVPADAVDWHDGKANSGGMSSHKITVQWNTRTKLYQWFDRSNDEYLSELSALEIPQSILK